MADTSVSRSLRADIDVALRQFLLGVYDYTAPDRRCYNPERAVVTM
jgi:hypothetical protein